MRVLQIAGLAGPGPIAGGVWSVAQAQSAALQAAGHDVDLVGGWLGSDPPNADYIRLRRVLPGGGLRFLYAARLKKFLGDRVAAADVVHIHLSRDHFTTTALDLVRHKPVVVQSHGMVGEARTRLTRAFDLLYRGRYLRVPSRWLALTDAEAVSLLSFGIAPDSIGRVNNASSDPRPTSSARPELTTFAFISRLHPRKQPDVFVRAALEVLDHRSASFVLVGPDQGAERTTRGITDASEWADRFDYRGPLPSDEVGTLLQSVTALVLPSRGEIAPMIAIEAAAAATPIVLTTDCGLADEFDRAEAAIVVDPEPKAVAGAMLRIANDPTLARRLGSRARELYLSNWSPDALAQTLLGHYYDAVGAQAQLTADDER